MTWTPRGIEQIGVLPDAPPATLPPRWFVEPIARLDRPHFDALLTLVRAEHIPGLSLRNQTVGAWLAALHDLPDLEALNLDSTDVDTTSLASVDLALRRLDLAHTAADDTTAAVLARKFPALESLDLEDTALTDAGVRPLTTLPLRALHLAATRITDAGGASLAPLHRLSLLDLGATKVGRRTIATLRTLPLHELFLDHTPLGREVTDLAPLAPQLLRLDISSIAHHATDRELAWLTAAPHLIELAISGAQVHDALASQLAALPPLRALRFADLPITLATIQLIAARRDLEELDLADTPVDDTSARAILASPALRVLRLDGTSITSAALDVTPSPELRELYVSYNQITDRGLAILAHLPHLTALGVGHTLLTDEGVRSLARCRELDTLILSHIAAAPAALALAASLPALERLYLDDTQADDAVLSSLTSDSLRVLHLHGTQISTIAALRHLASLDELTLGDTTLDASALAPAWPHLRTLSLVGLLLDDTALPILATHTSLTTLDLSSTNVRDPAPLLALPNLTTLGLANTTVAPASLRRLAARNVTVIR